MNDRDVTGERLRALRPGNFRLRNGTRGAGLNPSTSFTRRLCVCPSGAAVRRAKAQSLGQYPAGGCWESEARSYSAYPGFGGRKSSRFLGKKRWKSQKQNSVLSPNSVAVNGFGAKHPRSLTPMEPQRNNVGTPANTHRRRGSRAYLHHSPRVRTRRSRRNIFLLARALRVSRSASHRQAIWPLRPKPRRGCVSGGRVNPCCSIIASSRVSRRCSVVSHDRVWPRLG